MTKSIEMDRPEQKEDLWNRYRTAFGDWAQQVSRLERAEEQPHENGALIAAQHLTRVAEATYRESRDWLMEKIANAKPDSPDQLGSSINDSPGKRP